MTTIRALGVNKKPLSPTKAEKLASQFAALSDPVRLRLFELVGRSGASGVCSCDLLEPLDRSQPTISHHLKVLREAGLVESRRDGTWMWYSVRPESLQVVKQFVDASLNHIDSGKIS